MIRVIFGRKKTYSTNVRYQLGGELKAKKFFFKKTKMVSHLHHPDVMSENRDTYHLQRTERTIWYYTSISAIR